LKRPLRRVSMRPANRLAHWSRSTGNSNCLGDVRIWFLEAGVSQDTIRLTALDNLAPPLASSGQMFREGGESIDPTHSRSCLSGNASQRVLAQRTTYGCASY